MLPHNIENKNLHDVMQCTHTLLILQVFALPQSELIEYCYLILPICNEFADSLEPYHKTLVNNLRHEMT